MINYTLVAEGAMLRDSQEVKYMNDEHHMLTDIADFFYNANLGAEYLKPEYRELYDRYGKDYFHKVLHDMDAIDSQIGSPVDYEDLAEEYQYLMEHNYYEV